MILRNYFLVLIFLLSYTFSSCRSPMDKTYDAATYQDDIESIRQSNKISEEDIELLTKYMVVAKLAGNDLQGKTYNEILDRIKEIRKANGERNDQSKFEQESKRERLSGFLSVKLLSKVFNKINKKDCFIYTVNFKNASAKNIKMIVGSISINDLLDREIKKVDILSEEHLKPYQSLNKNFIVEYNNSENDKRIRTNELINLRAEWNPDKIIFEDGHIAE